MSAIIAALPRRNDLVRIIATRECGRVVDVIRGPSGVRVLVELAPSLGKSILAGPHEIEIYGRMRQGVVIDPGDVEDFIVAGYPGGDGPQAA
jgi:hypothetical protein